MTSLRRLTYVAAALAWGLGAEAGPPAPGPREELEQLARHLEAAVRRVSLPGSEPLLGAESARGYYVAGVGAMFVVPPRAVPRPTRVLVLGPGRPPVLVDAPGAYAELEALLGPAEARRLTGRQRPRNAHERELDRLAEQFRRQAEEASREMELLFEAWARGRVAPVARPRGGATVADSAPAPGSGTALPGSEGAAAPGPPPAGALPGEVNGGSPSALLDDAPADTRPPEIIVGDVREAVVAALAAHGAGLRGVGSAEQVSVAVDFVPRGVISTDSRPARTLVVRVSKRALDERAAGRLDPAAFQKQVQISEY
jgi:hypothetical protein